VKLVDPTSLGVTLDRLNEALFFDRALAKADREEAAHWIAARQGLPGSYAGLFAVTPEDLSGGATVFTGEKVRTGAATRHILGEEAGRALALLGVKSADVREAMKRAGAGMEERVVDWERTLGHAAGMYCCGICTCSYWRNLTAGGLSHAGPRLARGLKDLKAHRLAGGTWRRFPLHYTLLALVEMDLPGAIGEMRHAAPALERSLKRAARDDMYATRRRVLAQRVLARV
jgi:hypothetical protein